MSEVSNPTLKLKKNKYQKRTYTLNGETKTLMEWSKALDMSYTLLAHRWQKKVPAEIALLKENHVDFLENGRVLIYKGRRRIRGFLIDGAVKSTYQLSIGGEYKINQLERAWDENLPIESIHSRRKITMLNKNNSTKRPEYLRWCGLKARCLQKTNNRYHLYGGRGIKVYEPWIKDFWAFLDHIGDMPGPEYTVDRIDPDKNYEPGNVRWLPKVEQINTRRITLTATMNGERKTLKQWAIQYGVIYETVRDRIRRGWSIEQAVKDVPPKKITKQRGWLVEGKWWSLRDVANKSGHSLVTIGGRYEAGWTFERAMTQPQKKYKGNKHGNKRYTQGKGSGT